MTESDTRKNITERRGFEYRIEKKIRKLARLNPDSSIWKLHDFVFFYVVIGAVITFLYLLPSDVKYDYFILQPSNPTLLSLFFSNYTHIAFPHFINNLMGYWAVIFLLFNLETEKKIFYTISALIFIILPFLSSFAITYYTDVVSPVYGFSAILSGFIGYLLYAIYNYLVKVYKFPLNLSFPFLIVSINLTFVIIFNLNVPNTLRLITIAIAVLLTYINWKNIKEILNLTINQIKNPMTNQLMRLCKILFFVFVFIFLFILPFLIPSEIVNGKIKINILSHYIGYCFGVFIPIIFEDLPRLFKNYIMR